MSWLRVEDGTRQTHAFITTACIAPGEGNGKTGNRGRDRVDLTGFPVFIASERLFLVVLSRGHVTHRRCWTRKQDTKPGEDPIMENDRNYGYHPDRQIS